MNEMKGKIMELSDLTAYAKEKYGIQEERGIDALPNCSALPHPRTGKWIAYLMRQWDMETGTEIECCDIRCGLKYTVLLDKPYMGFPFRMRGTDWAGVALDKGAEPEVVFKLLDEAVVCGEPRDLSAVKLGSELPDRAAQGRKADAPRQIWRVHGRAGFAGVSVEKRLSGRASAVFQQYVQAGENRCSRAHPRAAPHDPVRRQGNR